MVINSSLCFLLNYLSSVLWSFHNKDICSKVILCHYLDTLAIRRLLSEVNKRHDLDAGFLFLLKILNFNRTLLLDHFLEISKIMECLLFKDLIYITYLIIYLHFWKMKAIERTCHFMSDLLAICYEELYYLLLRFFPLCYLLQFLPLLYFFS